MPSSNDPPAAEGATAQDVLTRPDILSQVMARLDSRRDLASAAQVCTAWRSAADESPAWDTVLERLDATAQRLRSLGQLPIKPFPDAEGFESDEEEETAAAAAVAGPPGASAKERASRFYEQHVQLGSLRPVLGTLLDRPALDKFVAPLLEREKRIGVR